MMRVLNLDILIKLESMFGEFLSSLMGVSHYDQAIHLNPNLDSAYANRGLVRSDLALKKEAIAPYKNHPAEMRSPCTAKT